MRTFEEIQQALIDIIDRATPADKKYKPLFRFLEHFGLPILHASREAVDDIDGYKRLLKQFFRTLQTCFRAKTVITTDLDGQYIRIPQLIITNKPDDIVNLVRDLLDDLGIFSDQTDTFLRSKIDALFSRQSSLQTDLVQLSMLHNTQAAEEEQALAASEVSNGDGGQPPLG